MQTSVTSVTLAGCGCSQFRTPIFAKCIKIEGAFNLVPSLSLSLSVLIVDIVKGIEEVQTSGGSSEAT